MTKAKTAKTHRVIIEGPFYGSAQPARLTINGRRRDYAVNQEIDIDDEQREALDNSDYRYTLVGSDDVVENADGAVVPDAAGNTADPTTADTPSDQTHKVDEESDDDADRRDGPGATATEGDDGSVPPKVAGEGESATEKPAAVKAAAAKPVAAAKAAPKKAAAKPTAKKPPRNS